MGEVFWISRNGPRLAVVARPQGDPWLKDEMQELRENGIDTVVSLLEPHEAKWLGLGEEGSAAQNAGLEFLSYPIRDGRVPEDTAGFRRFVLELAEQLEQGKALGIHCRGCIGRATVTAACALIHMGWEASRALEVIERARGTKVPDSFEQEAWILDYEAEP